jgi:hypothetical protein
MPSILMSAKLLPEVHPGESDVPAPIEAVPEIEAPVLTELQSRVRLLATSKQARIEHLAEWMVNTRDVRVAELLLRACGDLLPVQLLQQNNYQQKAVTTEAEALMAVISNGRGPNEWAPPPPQELEHDPILDAPADDRPIPQPPEEDLEALLETV